MGPIYLSNPDMTQSNLGGPRGPRGPRPGAVGATGPSRCEWPPGLGVPRRGVLPWSHGFWEFRLHPGCGVVSHP
jgi:hypothetical protein